MAGLPGFPRVDRLAARGGRAVYNAVTPRTSEPSGMPIDQTIGDYFRTQFGAIDPRTPAGALNLAAIFAPGPGRGGRLPVRYGAAESPPPGFVRLYRGEHGSNKGRGRWFTPDRSYALGYAGGKSGVLRYVDVPKHIAQQHLRGTLKYPGSHVKDIFHPDAGSEFILPREWSAQALVYNPARSPAAAVEPGKLTGTPRGKVGAQGSGPLAGVSAAKTRLSP